MVVKGGRHRTKTRLKVRQEYHDTYLEKQNRDGKRAYIRPGSHKK